MHFTFMNFIIKVLLSYFFLSGLGFYGDSKANIRTVDLRSNYIFSKNCNEGNFLGLLKLISSENNILLQYLNDCKQITSKRQATFLSPSFIYKVLRSARNLIVNKCVSVINSNNGFYSLETDTTADVATIDQCSIVVRFVNSNFKIMERTLAFTEMKKGKTGEQLFHAVKTNLEAIGLSTHKILGFALDGASSNTSANKGLNHYIKKENPSSVFIWCFSHLLNLVLKYACGSSNELSNIFDFAHDVAAFFKSSTKQMDIWRETLRNSTVNKLMRLQLIGDTRWSSKYKALTNIVKTPENFYVLLKSLHAVSLSQSSDKQAKEEANRLLKFWLNQQNIITVYSVHKILATVQQLTIFLQTQELDIMSAMTSIEDCYRYLKSLKDSAEALFVEANEFLNSVYVLMRKDKTCKIIEKFFSVEHREFTKFRHTFDSFIVSLLTIFENRFLRNFSNGLNKQIQIFNPVHFTKLLENDCLICVHKLCQLSAIEDEVKTCLELKKFAKEFVHSCAQANKDKENEQLPNSHIEYDFNESENTIGQNADESYLFEENISRLLKEDNEEENEDANEEEHPNNDILSKFRKKRHQLENALSYLSNSNKQNND